MAQGFLVEFPQRLFDANGDPANAWLIHTYLPGSTTPLTTYSDATLLSANTNPIVTDSAGYFKLHVAAGVLIKASVTDAAGVPQAAPSFDNELPMPDTTGGGASVTAVPVGGGCMWFTATPPSGFLIADGAVVSRTTFSGLFTVIGTTFGAGDGVTTFAIPDLRGRFPMGVAASGTGSALGATFGAIDHTHPQTIHTHPVTLPKGGWNPTASPVAPATNGVLSVGAAAGAGQFSSQYQPLTDQVIATDPSAAIATGTSNPPGLAVYWIIKT